MYKTIISIINQKGKVSEVTFVINCDALRKKNG